MEGKKKGGFKNLSASDGYFFFPSFFFPFFSFFMGV